MDIPDLLKLIDGAVMIVDEETAEKINRRTVTFQTANSIYLPRVAALYRECHPVSVDDCGNNSANKLETGPHGRGGVTMDIPDLLKLIEGAVMIEAENWTSW